MPGSLAELDIEFRNLAAATGNGAPRLSRTRSASLFYPAFNLVISRLNAGARLLLAHRKIFEALGPVTPPRRAHGWKSTSVTFSADATSPILT